jgi:cell division transport system permease protein
MANAKQSLAQKKQFRRKWLTSSRMVRYGINNFSRNLWLTAAATVVMTITLTIVFMTLATRNVLQGTLDQVKNNAGYSIYLSPTITDRELDHLAGKLHTLASVQAVTVTTVSQAKQDFAKQHSKDVALLSELAELPNQIPASIQVVARNPENTSEIQNYIKTDREFQSNLDASHPPSFNNQSLRVIASWGSFAQRAGIIVSLLFVVFSILIVFNTIRMAIFNRKEEIQMMKIIGADRSFIRGPFVVEAVVYGFIAALISTGAGFMILLTLKKPLANWFNVQSTIDLGYAYFPVVVLGMVVLGAFVGILSSLLAVRRYLKI